MSAEPARHWSISEFTRELRLQAELSERRVIDLGQGTPVDPTPEVAAAALARSGQAPGYPKTQGSPALRQAYQDWAERRLGADVSLDAVIPTVGSKELIAGLPGLLGLSTGSLVVIPRLAYPTYAYGAARVGARVLAADSTVAIGPSRPQLLWLNTPSNPTGAVLPEEHLRKVVDWARQRGCLVVSDECYLELGSPGQSVPSILSPDVNGGSLDGILAVHSLSKRSSMAGYRIGFIAGDEAVIARLTQLRRDLGLILPDPLQSVAAAVLADDEHVVEARTRYNGRRLLLESALREAGYDVDEGQSGLFVWASRARDGQGGARDEEMVRQLAAVGLLTAPGGFYGAAGINHVRLSLTVEDHDLEVAAARILETG